MLLKFHWLVVAHARRSRVSCNFKRAGTGYTVLPAILPAILPAVEGIILRMLRALKKNLYKKPKKAKKKSCLSEGSNPGIRTHISHKQCL